MRGTLITAATVAEENGLSFGMRALLNETLPELGIKPDFAVLGEPTGLGFYYGHDGWMEMDLKLEGSNIFHIQDAASIISSQIKADYPERNTGEYELQAPEFQAGKSASIRLKLRLNSSEKAQEVVTRVENRAHVASQSAGIMAVNGFLRKETKNMYTGSSSQALHNVPAWLTDPFHPMMETARQSLAAAGCAVRTGKWKLKNLGMGTAGGLLWNDFGIPTIGYGPGQEEMAHAVNECVAVKSIEEAIYGSAVMAHGIAGIPVCGWTLDEI
jgi:acetylornithine deacetylase/succinyl-diaminopimelate desuccinylase-like protein